MFCRECGTENEDNAKFCRNCGLPIVPVEETIQPEVEKKEEPVVDTPVAETVETPVTPVAEPQAAPGPQAAPDPAASQPQQNMPYGTPGPQAAFEAQGNSAKPVSGSAIVSLILGIVSVVCCCTCIIGIGCGIAAICLAVSDRKKNGSNGLTTAGLVLGICGISFAVIYIIWFIASGELDRLLTAIKYGNLQDYLNHFGNTNWYSGF